MKENLTEAVVKFLEVPKRSVECTFKNEAKEVIVKIVTMDKRNAIKIEDSINSLNFKKELNKKVSTFKIKRLDKMKKKDGKKTMDCVSNNNCLMLRSTTMAMVTMTIGNYFISFYIRYVILL